MRIFLAGGTGFLGSALVPRLLETGHTVTALVRSKKKAHLLPPGVTQVSGDPTLPGRWQDEVRASEAIINLCGQSIMARWTPKVKKMIQDSRVLSTRHIVEAIDPAAPMKQTLINASAAGYFGLNGDADKDEDAPAGSDFLARVCIDWEKEAFKACHKGTRVVTTRFGVVLSKKGGALPKMLPAFKLGVAGRLGSGRQWFPWIHLDDLLAALLFCLDHPEITGAVNCCAPIPVSNAGFTKALGAALHRPTVLPVPRFAVKLALGELGNILLGGSRVVPGVLVKHHFPFQYPDITSALTELTSP